MTVTIESGGIVDLRGLLKTELEEATMQQCLSASRIIYQGKINDRLACVWGLIPPTIMSDRAYIWLHTTEVADEHTFILVRYSQHMIEKMLGEFEALVGHCKIGNDRAIRWLRWLGAEFGPYEGKLIPFVIRRKHG
jgi:hypothetical protein